MLSDSSISKPTESLNALDIHRSWFLWLPVIISKKQCPWHHLGSWFGGERALQGVKLKLRSPGEDERRTILWFCVLVQYLSQWLTAINVSNFLRESRDSATEANHCPEYLPFRPHRDKICMPLSTKESTFWKEALPKPLAQSEISCLGWDICCPCFRLWENLVEKAELLGQGSPRGRQAWDLRCYGKLSSVNHGCASSGHYCYPALIPASEGYLGCP